jgi:hypothetical protein
MGYGMGMGRRAGVEVEGRGMEGGEGSGGQQGRAV